MKAKLESFSEDQNQSLRILLTPRLNEIFYWHFHPEMELVYVESDSGVRQVGDHITRYQGSDLVLIGPNIPHLNFDYGVKQTVETVVVQMKEDFLGETFLLLPEVSAIKDLFERAKEGIAFSGQTKEKVGEKLKNLPSQPPFEQLISMLEIFDILSRSDEIELLHAKPLANASLLKEQQRIKKVYHFIEVNFQRSIEVHEIARLCNLSTPAFCRYFKKSTHYTFTEFLNIFRVNQSKKILLQDKNVSEACYESGFSNISHFNKTFKKITGENPSAYKKKYFQG